MLWLIFTMLSVLGAVGLLAPYVLVAGVIQILLISTLVALGIHRVRAVSTRCGGFRRISRVGSKTKE
jgi:hypothetical protein